MCAKKVKKFENLTLLSFLPSTFSEVGVLFREYLFTIVRCLKVSFFVFREISYVLTCIFFL